MRRKLFKNAFLAGILVFSAAGVLTACGGEELPVETLPSVLYLQGKTSVKVGETTTLSVGGALEGDTFLWVSSDESIATVDGNGAVTGITEGSTVITAYKSDDFSKKASLEIYVYGDTNAGKEVSTLTIDTSAAKLTFTQGDLFTCEGLVVKKDGAEVSDFSTNPAEGTLLVNLGTFDVYVSVDGAASVSYQITVEAVKEDLSLSDFVESLSTAGNYEYSITIDGQVDYGGDTLANQVSYSYIFGDEDYYYQVKIDGAVYESQSYGFVNTSKGVMKFELDDEVVNPLCYYSLDSKTTYMDLIANVGFNELDSGDMPRRLTDGYFKITDQEAINTIIYHTNLSTSNIYANLVDVKAYLTEETLSIVIDCGLMGTITETYSNVGSAKVPYISEYLAENGEDLEVDEDLTRMLSLVNAGNYTMSMGSVVVDGETINVGSTYYTENYFVNDYSDEYIAAAKEQGVDVVDNGQYYDASGKYAYSFNLTKGEDGVEQVDLASVTKEKYATNVAKFQENNSYPNTLSAFAHPEMFEHKVIPEYGSDPIFMDWGDDDPTELYDYLGFSFETTGLFPYGFGLAWGTENDVDALCQINVLSYVFDFSGTNYCYGFTLRDFGITKVEAVDTVLASL